MNPHQRQPTGLFYLSRSVWRNRELVFQLTRREVIGRYRGSLVGLGWSFLLPVSMLLVYTFVFSVVFKARWGVGAEESQASFAIVLFVGMIVHSLFAEVANRAPGLILANVSYVKRVVFPLELLPIVSMGSAIFHSAASLAALLLAQLIVIQYIPWTAILLPIVISPLVLGTLGFAWVLSSVGVYLRDIGQTINILTTVMLFLSPVFYPISALPEPLRRWLWLNPLTFPIEEARKVLLLGQLPDWGAWGLYLTASVLMAWIGFWWFQKTRTGFADVV